MSAMDGAKPKTQPGFHKGHEKLKPIQGVLSGHTGSGDAQECPFPLSGHGHII